GSAPIRTSPTTPAPPDSPRGRRSPTARPAHGTAAPSLAPPPPPRKRARPRSLQRLRRAAGQVLAWRTFALRRDRPPGAALRLSLTAHLIRTKSGARPFTGA